MPAINVYINEQLKSDMDSIDETVNWSATCQSAIEREVARIKATNGDDKYLLERVRKAGSKQHDAGYQAGTEFARGVADVDDFEAFEDFDTRVERIEAHNMTDEAAERLAFLEIANELDLDDASYFCGKDLNRRHVRWLRGFAQAMDDAWAPIRRGVVL